MHFHYEDVQPYIKETKGVCSFCVFVKQLYDDQGKHLEPYETAIYTQHLKLHHRMPEGLGISV